MAKAVFDELSKDQPKPRFTVGIVDDVTHLSPGARTPTSVSPTTTSLRSSSASAPTAPWVRRRTR